jgi:hypothetical protein
MKYVTTPMNMCNCEFERRIPSTVYDEYLRLKGIDEPDDYDEVILRNDPCLIEAVIKYPSKVLEIVDLPDGFPVIVETIDEYDHIDLDWKTISIRLLRGEYSNEQLNSLNEYINKISPKPKNQILEPTEAQLVETPKDLEKTDKSIADYEKFRNSIVFVPEQGNGEIIRPGNMELTGSDPVT